MSTVSVVLISYNRSGFLKISLQSVLNQSYQDFEIVLVDGSDKPEHIAAVQTLCSAEKRVRLLRIQNKGVSAARNHGIEHAQGDYIAFLDDDDEWYPGHLQEHVRYLDANPKASFVLSQAEIIDQHGKKPGRRIPEKPLDGTRVDLYERPIVLSSAQTVRASAIEQAGHYKPKFDLNEDFEFAWRLAMAGEYCMIPYPTLGYRRHSGCTTHRLAKQMYMHVHSLLQIPAGKHTGVRYWQKKRRIARVRYKIAEEHYNAGEWRQAFAQLLKACAARPDVGLRTPGILEGRSSLYRLLRPHVLLLKSLIQMLRPSQRFKSIPPRKILYVFHRQEWAGAAQSMQETIRSLDPEIYKACILVPGERDFEAIDSLGAIPVYEYAPIEWRFGKLRHAWAQTAYLADWLKMKEIGLVHINFHTDAPAIGLASWLAGIRYLVQVRVMLWMTWAQRFWLARAQAVVCVSHATRRWVTQPRRSDFWTRYRKDHIFVHADGRDLSRFASVTEQDAETVRKELGIRSEQPLIGIVGLLERNKNQELFLRAAAELLKHEPEARFLVVGDTGMDHHAPYKDYLHTLAEELELNAKLIFTGARKDIPALMKSLDVLVLASLRDAFPGVIIEAMASGTAVVTTWADGGAPEVLGDSGAGVVLKTYEAPELAQTLLRLIRNPEEIRKMGEAGKKSAAERFAVRINSTKMAAIYNCLFEGLPAQTAFADFADKEAFDAAP
ncbi:MAG: glycosyltransferase [Candidatus Omnitrophica bacterium]|nr:glycosyltransferase [Candidatus Omnitrophota bacterium]